MCKQIPLKRFAATNEASVSLCVCTTHFILTEQIVNVQTNQIVNEL